MVDVKQKIQSKVKELRELNQEFRNEYPELINNYWFDVILDRIKKGRITDGEFFEPDNDLNQIDQAASFFNIDYDFYCEWQHGLCGSLSFCVIFDFSKPYDRQKAIKEQQVIAESNSQLNSKWSGISAGLMLSSLVAFIGSFFYSMFGIYSMFGNRIIASIMLGLGLIMLVVGIIGDLINNNRAKKVFVSASSSLQKVNYH